MWLDTSILNHQPLGFFFVGGEGTIFFSCRQNLADEIKIDHQLSTNGIINIVEDDLKAPEHNLNSKWWTGPIGFNLALDAYPWIRLSWANW